MKISFSISGGFYYCYVESVKKSMDETNGQLNRQVIRNINQQLQFHKYNFHTKHKQS